MPKKKSRATTSKTSGARSQVFVHMFDGYLQHPAKGTTVHTHLKQHITLFHLGGPGTRWCCCLTSGATKKAQWPLFISTSLGQCSGTRKSNYRHMGSRNPALR